MWIWWLWCDGILLAQQLQSTAGNLKPFLFWLLKQYFLIKIWPGIVIPISYSMWHSLHLKVMKKLAEKGHWPNLSQQYLWQHWHWKQLVCCSTNLGLLLTFPPHWKDDWNNYMSWHAFQVKANLQSWKGSSGILSFDFDVWMNLKSQSVVGCNECLAFLIGVIMHENHPMHQQFFVCCLWTCSIMGK